MQYESLIEPPASKALKSGRVVLGPGEDVGEHITQSREELIIILKGKARLEKDGEIIYLREGETHFIPEGIRHNVVNAADSELEYIYIVAGFA